MSPDGGVLTLGETMASLRSSGPLRLGGPLHLSIAGAESNVAIGLARLGHRASWAGVVGADELGALILRILRAEGVALGAARVEPAAPTGLILFEHRIADITRVQYRRAGSAGSRLSPADVDAAFAAGPPAVLHWTGITPALGEAPRQAVAHAAALARAAGSLRSFNVNYRAALWPRHDAAAVISSLAAGADLVVAAADELFLAVPGTGPSGRGGSRDEPEQARILLESGTGEVLVTAGSAGATLYRPDGMWQQPAAHVRAVDSVGAGDAFIAGYLSGLLDGLAPQDRLARAATTAAFSVAALGDWEGLPTRAELPLLASGPGATLR